MSSNAETNAHLERIAKALEKIAGIDRDEDFTGGPRRLTGYQEPTDVPREVWDGEKLLRRVEEGETIFDREDMMSAGRELLRRLNEQGTPLENGDYLLHDDGKEGEDV